MATASIAVLIVDDERLARERLRVLLSGEPAIEVVGECANGLQALAAITRTHPELVFLDVQMPDLDGLGVIAALPSNGTPEIIFVTAHNAYMERAFEIHAVDYLQKPYTNSRFASALEFAKRRVYARRAEATRVNEGVKSVESKYAPMLATLQSVHADPRLAVQDARSGTWHIVSREAIDWIQAEGSSRVSVHVGAETYFWRKTLTDLEHILDPRVFLRVHRSYIVNATRIRHVKPLQKGEYAIILAGEKMLDTGRTYRDVIETFLRTRE